MIPYFGNKPFLGRSQDQTAQDKHLLELRLLEARLEGMAVQHAQLQETMAQRDIVLGHALLDCRREIGVTLDTLKATQAELAQVSAALEKAHAAPVSHALRRTKLAHRVRQSRIFRWLRRS